MAPHVQRVLAFLLLVGTAGCAKLVTPLPPDRPVAIEPGQGILVVETDTNAPLELLELAGPAGSGFKQQIEDLPSGRHIHLVALSEGEYRWDRVEMEGTVYQGRSYPIRWNLAANEHMRVTVQAGTVNYPGMLVLFRSKRSYLSAFTIDRSGELVSRIEQEYPDLLSRYPMRYVGRGRDDFIRFYQESLRERRASDKEVPEEEDALSPPNP
jgi:hypothetical protein